MKTHNLGRVFWHPVRLTGAPLVHRGKTSMTHRPYYHARPLIFRAYLGYGIAIGIWRKRKVLDVSWHLANALTLNHLERPTGLIEGSGRAGAPRSFLITGEDQFYGASPEREP